MAKYSYEFKNKVVHEYLQGVNSYRTLAKKYNISDAICIRNWVAAYETFGEEGLQRSRQNKTYSFQFKLHAVQLYLESELSYKKLAMSLGIKEPSDPTKLGQSLPCNRHRWSQTAEEREASCRAETIFAQRNIG